VYAGGGYEVELSVGGSEVTRTTYYNALTARVMRVVTGTLANSAVYYILTDQLGSASVTPDSGGGVVGQRRYTAYGATLSATGLTPTSRRYTSQPGSGYHRIRSPCGAW
jgi:hypothetical protein